MHKLLVAVLNNLSRKGGVQLLMNQVRGKRRCERELGTNWGGIALLHRNFIRNAAVFPVGGIQKFSPGPPQTPATLSLNRQRWGCRGAGGGGFAIAFPRCAVPP